MVVSKTGVIILSHDMPEEMKKDIRSILKRKVTHHELKSLSELQVTQRLVYSVQSNFHLPSNGEDRETFQVMLRSDLYRENLGYC